MTQRAGKLERCCERPTQIATESSRLIYRQYLGTKKEVKKEDAAGCTSPVFCNPCILTKTSVKTVFFLSLVMSLLHCILAPLSFSHSYSNQRSTKTSSKR